MAQEIPATPMWVWGSHVGFSLVIKQEHNGVELTPGAVVGTQGHDEVVQPVACCLGRHDDEFVLEAIGLGIL